MKLVKNKSRAFSFLILFSLLTFAVWRFEVEFHGWRGLIWLTYFHISIPISLSLFILWTNIFFKFQNHKRRLTINLLLFFWVVVGYFLFVNSLQSTFISGPSAIFYYFQSESIRNINKFFSFIILPLFPTISILSLRFLNIKTPSFQIFFSQFIFLLAFPFSVFLLEISSHKGSPDFIHAVKSGLVFPFLFFSLGLPLIYSYFIPIFKSSESPTILDDFN